MMETPNTLHSGMCRCCSSEGTFKDIKTKYHWMGEEEVYAEMLTDCFDIKIQTPEDMDNGICEVCITQLRNAVNFKKQVLHTEEQFKRRLQGRDVKNPIKIESVEDPNDSDHLSDPDFTEEYEVPIKQEVEEKPKAKKRQAKPATPRAKKAKTEAESSQRLTKKSFVKVKSTPKNQKKTSSNIASAVKAGKAQPLKGEVRKNERVTIRKRADKNKTKEKDQKPIEIHMHRNNIREILANSNATPIRCHGDIGFTCCFCPKQFPSPADLKNHTIQEHDHKTKQNFMGGGVMHSYIVKLDITSLCCELCASDLESLDQMVHHLIERHGKKLYTDIKNHILPFKFDDDKLRCVMCKVEFNSFKHLQEHMIVHFRNYVCDICDSGFINRRMQRAHAKTHLTGKFVCSTCSKVFDTVLKLKSHERQVHSTIKYNKCGYCSEKFKDFKHKLKHLTDVHGIKKEKSKCKACDKAFSSPSALSVHIKRNHLIERHHKCDQCEMTFYSIRELEHHLVKHSGTREFQCDVCYKYYGLRKTLVEHMRIHTNDRRFECPHCGMTFVQKCSLKGHLRCKHSELT
ncbi:PR domain zinc finger protein 5-like isoform X7 [Cydia splendana]|uniref:PR domain zinc finger protein 5-like isoform X7 n=1 Tax=Cydia splendana TaxID=1100963 RepID=UPI00213B4541